LSYFEHHLKRRWEAEDSELNDGELLELMIREQYIGLEYIPKQAIHMQNNYMRHGLYMGLNTSVHKFVGRKRFNDLNLGLLYSPEQYPKQLDQDETIEFLDQAKARNPE
jgi:hypothetical protein